MPDKSLRLLHPDLPDQWNVRRPLLRPLIDQRFHAENFR